MIEWAEISKVQKVGHPIIGEAFLISVLVNLSLLLLDTLLICLLHIHLLMLLKVLIMRTLALLRSLIIHPALVRLLRAGSIITIVVHLIIKRNLLLRLQIGCILLLLLRRVPLL